MSKTVSKAWVHQSVVFELQNVLGDFILQDIIAPKYLLIKFNCEAWRVKDDLRRLTYNLMRCPPEFLDILGQMYEYTKPEIAGCGLSKSCREITLLPLNLFNSNPSNPVSYVH